MSVMKTLLPRKRVKHKLRQRQETTKVSGKNQTALPLGHDFRKNRFFHDRPENTTSHYSVFDTDPEKICYIDNKVRGTFLWPRDWFFPFLIWLTSSHSLFFISPLSVYLLVICSSGRLLFIMSLSLSHFFISSFLCIVIFSEYRRLFSSSRHLFISLSFRHRVIMSSSSLLFFISSPSLHLVFSSSCRFIFILSSFLHLIVNSYRLSSSHRLFFISFSSRHHLFLSFLHLVVISLSGCCLFNSSPFLYLVFIYSSFLHLTIIS